MAWTLNDMPLESIDRSLVVGRDDLLCMAAAASFTESGADLYTANLLAFFEDDQEVGDWLRRRWLPEELGHGRALRAYIGHVWPEFDWDAAYQAFLAEYSRVCTVGNLAGSRSLELAARCVVETGTATIYRAFAAQAGEPVLAGIASRISGQEVDHYKHFYAFFRRYRVDESPGRLRVALTLAGRMLEARQGDAEIALWHAYRARRGQTEADRQGFSVMCKRIGRQLRRHYPGAMAARMLIKPIDLPAPLAHAAQGAVTQAIMLGLR